MRDRLAHFRVSQGFPFVAELFATTASVILALCPNSANTLLLSEIEERFRGLGCRRIDPSGGLCAILKITSKAWPGALFAKPALDRTSRMKSGLLF